MFAVLRGGIKTTAKVSAYSKENKIRNSDSNDVIKSITDELIKILSTYETAPHTSQ